MAKQNVPITVELKDVVYFIRKGEVDKAIQILEAMIKKYSPKEIG